MPSVTENEEFSFFHFGPFPPHRIGQKVNIVQGLGFPSFSISSAFFSVVTCVRVWSHSAVPVGNRPIPSESSSGYRSGENQLQAAFEAQRTPVVWTKLSTRLHPHQPKGAYWQKVMNVYRLPHWEISGETEASCFHYHVMSCGKASTTDLSQTCHVRGFWALPDGN